MNNQNLYWGEPEDVTTESGLPDEPVTVQEFKDWARLEGFVDADESTTESLSDFGFDDTLIGNMITAARQKAERYCGISIVFHSWQDIITNGAGDIEVRMGPVQGAVTATATDTDLTEVDIETTGFNFKTIDTTSCDKRIIAYDAGYEDCPEEIRLAIKQMVSVWYDNRAVGPIPAQALSTLQPFKRVWTWLA